VKIDGKTVLVCDCGATMALDGARLAADLGADEAATVHHALCRSGIAAFEQAVADGGPVLVGCTQEAALFSEVAAEKGGDAALGFVDLRERAGWGEAGEDAAPKIAALIAEAAVPVPPVPAVTLNSGGVTLIYGRDETALEVARQLAGRLEVTVLLDRPDAVMPPRVREAAIFRGTVARASGHFGAFALVVDGWAPARASSRTTLEFKPGRDGVELRFDLILDLTGGTPLLRAPEARDGYFNPDPGNPAAVQKALFDLVDLVGAFDKPRYVDYDPAICVHGRSRKIGCSRCLDACPTAAVSADGDQVAFDTAVCAGCGQCASVCPTGAATYALPAPKVVYARLAALLGRYREAGGQAPVLLVHDTESGADLIAAIGRYGRGLPANLLPFALNTVTQLGLDFLLAALAHGVARVVVLSRPRDRDARFALDAQIEIANAVTAGLGAGAGHIAVIDDTDPDRVAARLWEWAAAAEAEGSAFPAGGFLAMGGKRDRMRLALQNLHDHAPVPVDRLALPAGAPFGAVAVATEGCTLCLACVGACPTGALIANPDKPQLGFREQACVQCGLCRNTCPESVIALEPRLDFTAAAREARVLHEEEPFPCIRCGKPFGVRSMIEKMAERLSDHSMFAGDGQALDRIRMCDTCCVAAEFDTPNPLAGPPRPRPRTSDDYLRDDD
jgi:ferredoxin